MELELQNPEFKILYCQNPEFKILDVQNPEFKILYCQNPRACSAVVFDEFISQGKLFYRGHKTCNFFTAIFHKNDSWKKRPR